MKKMMSTVIYDRTVIYETLCNDQKVNIIFIIRCEIRRNFRTEISVFSSAKSYKKSTVLFTGFATQIVLMLGGERKPFS